MSRKDTVFSADLYQFAEIIDGNLATDTSPATLCLTRYETTIPTTDSDFLEKILQAVGPGVGTSLCLNIRQQPYSLSAFRRVYRLRYTLGFGVSPAEMGLQLNSPLYTPLVIGNIMLLFADPLAVIAAEKAKKALLWNALKVMYGVLGK